MIVPDRGSGPADAPPPPIVSMALAVAAAGWPVFAARATKQPLVKRWGRVATCDPDTIRRMFSRPDAQLIGVPTGKRTGFDVLDFDPRHGSDEWRAQNIDRLPKTRIHGTLNGGEHWLFRHVDGVRNRQDGKIASGIDVRGEGGYVIVPPSPGYAVINDASISEWPAWLLPLVAKRDEPRPRPAATPRTDELERRYRAFIDVLLANVRTAAEGTKHDTLLKQARAFGGVMDAAGIGEEEALSMLIGALPDTVLDWENARRTALDGLHHGRDLPIVMDNRPYPRANGAGQEEPEPPPPPKPEGPVTDNPVDAMVKGFNDRYFVINENGRVIIYAPRHDPILNRRFFDRLTFADFEKLYANRYIEVGGKMRNVAKLWLRHRDRRQFIGGVVFDPAGRSCDPDVLNLWGGFTVKPRAGSWQMLKEHIRDVICDSDSSVFTYLLDWMADLLQNPARQGEVAVVLRGQEGCGKGTLAKALKHLLGQHGLAISNARHLTGNFNAHLRDVVFLFADEAFFAGDRAHIGVLKALITEPYLTIEGKYQNAVQMPNFLHVMMASNEDWVVPASLNSRRWLVLDVPGYKIGDHSYFAAINGELEAGGYQAILDELLKRDISKSNLRAVPVTEALQTQRKRSVDTITAWWLDCLHRGYVFESKLGLEDHWGHWHDFLPTEVLFASYGRYCREHHERHPLTRELFGQWMRGVGANPGRMRNQAIGEHIVDALTDRSPTRVAELVMHAHPTGYTIGTLNDARLSFSSSSGLQIEWDG